MERAPPDVCLAGAHAVILHSGDGGRSWQEQHRDEHAGCFALWGSGPDDVYAACGELLRTTDHGRHWNSVSAAPANSYLVTGLGADAVHVVASHDGEMYVTYLTTDHGAHFTPSPTGATNALRGIAVASPDALYLVGSEGTILRGR